MRKDQVIITSLLISKAGQTKHFQIRLPKNASQVIGIELGGRFLDSNKTILSWLGKSDTAMAGTANPNPSLFKPNPLIGEVKLQSCERANVCYAGEWRLDNSMRHGDYSKNAYWSAKPYSHQANAFEEPIFIKGESTILQGIYKDNIGKQIGQDARYVANVYVWYQH